MVSNNSYKDPFSTPEKRADYEYALAKDCIIPMLDDWGITLRDKRVLDLGCGSGGMITSMAENGAICTGIDHNEQRVRIARSDESGISNSSRFFVRDILDLNSFDEKFDLITLFEVIEHLVTITNLNKIFFWCKNHLAPAGRIIVTFPPWLSPYGGHQSGWPRIRYIPWFHLMPDPFKSIFLLNMAEDYYAFTKDLNRITISAFINTVNDVGLSFARQDLYHVRPEYYWRYSVPIIRAPSFLGKIPAIREFMITGAFFLLA